MVSRKGGAVVGRQGAGRMGWAVSCSPVFLFFSPFSRSLFPSFAVCHALLGSGADWAPEGGTRRSNFGEGGGCDISDSDEVRWGIMRFVSFCEVLLCVCETYYAFSEGRMRRKEIAGREDGSD